MRKLILWVLVFFVLVSCASKKTNDFRSKTASLAEGIDFQLLPPSKLENDFELTQLAQIHINDEMYELVFYVKKIAGSLTVVGVLPSGIRVFTISYDGDKVISDGNTEVNNRLKPEYLLADLQLSLWPMKLLKEQWMEKLACFSQKRCSFSQSSDGTLRTLRTMRTSTSDDINVITIHFDRSDTGIRKLDFFHHLRDYHISLETLGSL